MQTTIKYAHEPGVFAWPIPFAFSDNSQVKAHRQDATGLEYNLVEGRDYQISANNLVYIIPEGCSLIIYLDADLDQVRAANSARVLRSMQAAQPVAQAAQTAQAAQPVVVEASQEQAAQLAAIQAELDQLKEEKAQALVVARQAEHDAQIQNLTAVGANAQATVQETGLQAVKDIGAAQASALNQLNQAEESARDASREAQAAAAQAETAGEQAVRKVEQSLARMETRLAQLEQTLTASASDGERQISRATAQGTEQIALVSAQARRTAEANARLSGDAWPQTGALLMRDACPAGAILSLPEPLAYYPGRQSLYIFLNGLALIAGTDYQEVGKTLSSAWRTQRELLVGDQLYFVIAPTNASQAAALASRDAGASAATAQNHAASAALAVKDCQALRGQCQDQAAEAQAHAGDAAQWLKLAEAQCVRAYTYAEEAARQHWHASVAAARPGIASVKNEAELENVVEGVYFINPHVSQTPTPFYGVWPVKDIDADPGCDGIFFLGPAYEREPYAPPEPGPSPSLPEPPAGTEVTAGQEWQPCRHTHHALCQSG